MAQDITTARLDIAKIYIAAFDRTADSAGLDFWVSSYMAGTDTLTTIAEKFTNSDEYKADYPSYLTNEEYVDAIYSNVFNRASDADGKSFWVNHLTAGTLTKGTLMKAMVDAAMANSSTDGAMLTNQATYSVYAAVNGVDTDLADARLNTITSEAATLEAAKSSVATDDAGVQNTLTSTQDVLVGTTGNDFFRAVAGSTVGTQDQTTLNSSDIIDGSLGTDSLIVNLVGGDYAGGARIKNIETLQIGTNDNARAFDYNVNMSSNEITEVNTIRYDQINDNGTFVEQLTVNNITKTATGNTAVPTVLWDNEAGSNAGFIGVNFRTTTVADATTLSVQLDDVKARVDNAGSGVMNIGAGVETISVNSQGTTANTLNNAGTIAGNIVTLNIPTNGQRADLVSGNSTADLKTVILTGSQAIGKVGTVVTTTTDNDFGLVNRAYNNSDLGVDTTTAVVLGTSSNLLSVANSVTLVNAEAMTASANVRFTANVNNAPVDVTFKGGSAADYVEFELGNVTATGGAGNDTFAFISGMQGNVNGTFSSTDAISGGEGDDTIQLGVNGGLNTAANSFTLMSTEFAGKTGIETLDVRAQVSNISLSNDFVNGVDSGKTLTVRTDKIVSTSDTNSANTAGVANNVQEDAAVNVLNLTELSGSKTLNVIGGSGSDRLVLNNSTFNTNLNADLGTNVLTGGVATAGDYDTVTIVNSAVVDRGDLANIKGAEGFVLTETTTGNSTFTIELTEAFVLNNTASANSTSSDIDDRVFTITTAAAATGSALNAGDTVTIDITDLLITNTTTLKTSLVNRGFDATQLVAAGVTVNYTANGVVVNPATVASLLLTSTIPASVTSSGANVSATATGLTWTSSAVGATTVLGTNNNDIFTLTKADTITAGTGSDTVNLNTGSDAATVTMGASADTINVNIAVAGDTNVVTAIAAGSTINVAVDQGGSIAADIITVGASTFNVSATQTAGLTDFTVDNIAIHTVNATAGGVFQTSAVGQNFNGSGTVGYTITGDAGVDTITMTNSAANTIKAGVGIDVITLTSSTGVDTIVFSDGVVGTTGITAVADRDVITGFNATNDIINLDDAQTTVAFGAIQSAVTNAAVITGTGVASVLALNFDLGGASNVIGASTDGSAIIANMAGAITVTNGDDGYIVAYDAGNAYLYAYIEANADTTINIGELTLIATLNGVAVGALGTANFAEIA